MEFLVYIFGILFLSGSLASFDEDVVALLKLTDLDLQDFCEEEAVCAKRAFFDKSSLAEKIDNQNNYGNYLRSEAEYLRHFEDVPYDHLRNWTLFTNPGDVLLSEADYGELVVFSNTLEGVILQKNNSLSNTDKTVDVLKASWEKKVKSVSKYVKDFRNFLNITKKAAKANKQSDVPHYWENLSESPDMYSKLQSLWDEVKPLYFKLHKFVKTRLFKHYGLDNNENSTEIPVYLLGSDFGEDWSSIAEFIVPHPQLYHDVLTEIKNLNIRKIYKIAENMTQQLGLNGLGKKFWTNSTFNSTNCNTVVFTHCFEEFSEISTCSNVTWKSFLEAHEVAMKIALDNVDYPSLPRKSLRFSAVDDAIVELSSILAVKNLPFHGILDPAIFKTEDEIYHNERMTALLLIALKVLPKLSYYVAVEKWRIEELQNQNGFVNLGEEWWKKRKEIQGVEGISSLEDDYLIDLNIIKNQPYLSKILGIFLQFQLHEYYYKSQYDPNQSLASFIGDDVNFKLFMKERPTRDWLSLTTYYFEISEISATPLVDFFKQLEEYLDKAPETQQQFVKKLPKLPSNYLDDLEETSTKKSKKTKKKEELLANPPIQVLEEEQLNPYPSATDHEEEEEANKKKKANKEGKGRASEDVNVEIQNDQGGKDHENEEKSGKIQGRGNKYNSDFSQTVGTYIGIVVIVCSVVTISTVLIRRKLQQKKRTNNRRFET